MTLENKKNLSERDICTKFITPAVRKAGWDVLSQIREEVSFTKGWIIVRGRLVTRGRAKRADYILYYKPNIPIALIEAKDNTCAVGGGMQQALGYAATLDIPFVFSSNGDVFLFHDRTGLNGQTETELSLDAFPSPEDLWSKYRIWKGLAPEQEEVFLQNYFEDGSGKEPRYYQRIAINKAIEAIAKGQDRILLVMATGTGKTNTGFQTIWRLWKAGRRKRILFLADRNVLVDQTMVNDFRPFGAAMAKLSTSSKTIEREDGAEVQLVTAVDKKHRRIDTSFEIYLALYQAITGPEERQKLYRELSRDFFDLIVVDECHRGSAAEDSVWREILDHFSGATQIGLTATPKETAEETRKSGKDSNDALKEAGASLEGAAKWSVTQLKEGTQASVEALKKAGKSAGEGLKAGSKEVDKMLKGIREGIDDVARKLRGGEEKKP